MRPHALRLAGLLALTAATAALQTPAPPAATAGPDEVVVTVEGEKITPARLKQLRNSLIGPFQQAASTMDNKTFLENYGRLLKFSRLAEEEKLTEQVPYKDQLLALRMQFLAQAYLDSLSKRLQGSPEEMQQYYERRKADYEEAVVKAILIGFSPVAAAKKPGADPKAKIPLTEEQAKAKAEALAAELKKGADFAKLAKENSDDTPSAAKGGDLGVIRRNATGIPAALKDAIFGLAPGETSNPIRQPAGYYIFRQESTRATPYEEVAPSIATAVQGEKVRAEIQRISGTVQIQYDNPKFFESGPPAPAPARR